MAGQGIRIGVDVGGTFTDLIAHEPSTGEVFVGKQLTSPARPDEGVLEAVAASLSADALNTAQTFVHGTTVGLNALLERRGATVGLLVTLGFRDVLELRRGDRDDPYDLFWRAPEPLVPRHLRLPVTERVRADGEIDQTLNADDVARAAEVFTANGVDAVAIAFMNAYANPTHEQEAERLLRAAGYEGDISVSHRVSGEYREYERTCTTVIDAFVRRRMGGYLDRLAAGLNDRGFTGGAFITRSGGGALSFPEATDRPFETIMSGPVAGVAAATQLTELLDLGDAIAADVGGTSFDTCLIADGRAPVLYEGSIIGLPLQTPWVDVRSIGAGGGSIASVDAGGLLRVGPRSAGARPGPACYGAGGSEPTVTDAAVLLGMLPPGPIAGDVVLDPDLARAALAPLAEPLGFATDDAEAVARGVIRVACAHMADAIRSITVESGRDPRDAAMIAFGGAGPVLATVMAHELDITTIVVPPHAGNLSAWGLLGVDLAQTSSRTRLTRLSDQGLQDAQALIAELTAELDRRSNGGAGGVPDPRRTLEVHADMRYVGQEHTLTIVLEGDAEAVRRTFSAEYQRAFGAILDEELEIVTFRVIATTPLSDTRGAHPAAGQPDAEDDATSIEAYSFTRGERVAFPIRARGALAGGDTIAGPAILTEPTTTTYLDAGHTATVHATGALVITKESPAA